MMKTLKVMVMVTIRANPDDDDEINEAVKERLQEAIEDDAVRFDVEESDEDEDF